MYREVKASERLPELNSNPVFVKLKDKMKDGNELWGDCLFLIDKDTWVWESQDGGYFVKTEDVDFWLEPINVSEEEVADTLMADAIKHGYHWRPTAAKAIMNLLKDK